MRFRDFVNSDQPDSDCSPRGEMANLRGKEIGPVQLRVKVNEAPAGCVESSLGEDGSSNLDFGMSNIKGAEYSNLANISPSTLLDIIRDEPFVSKENRKTWKHFTEKLRLKLPGSACTSTVLDPVLVPADDTPLLQIDNRTTDASRSTRFSAANSASEAKPPSVRLIQSELTASSEPPRRESDSATLIVLLQRSSSRTVDRETSRFDEAEANRESREASGVELEPETKVDQPARLSLMALLAKTDREMGIDGAAYVLGEEETEDETAGDGGKFILDNCCVCMVRHKGAAFIPYRHTFCRLCSRELWVQRGSCPLYNNSKSFPSLPRRF
nr:probable E3 ubiquitin-protein ligase LOG2 [Ipomoea trifida]